MRELIDNITNRPFHAANLFSFRAILGAAAFGVLVAIVPSLIWKPLGYVFIPAFAVAWIASGYLVVLYCPYCRKRVKAGATVCHHCGRTVTQGA
jgi:hypothetical protein